MGLGKKMTFKKLMLTAWFLRFEWLGWDVPNPARLSLSSSSAGACGVSSRCVR